MGQDLRFSTHDACETLTETVARTMSDRLPASKRYGSGSMVWRPTDRPDRLFRLDAGRVHIFSTTADGDEHLHRVVTPGELFGEMCFCPHRDEPHATFARSIGSSEVTAASYREFRHNLRSDASLVDSVIQTFCARVSESEQRQRILACRDARERLARFLLHLARQRLSLDDERSDVDLVMTHADLAASAALSRPHVSVLMAEFRERGLVSYGRTGALTLRVGQLVRELA